MELRNCNYGCKKKTSVSSNKLIKSSKKEVTYAYLFGSLFYRCFGRCCCCCSKTYGSTIQLFSFLSLVFLFSFSFFFNLQFSHRISVKIKSLKSFFFLLLHLHYIKLKKRNVYCSTIFFVAVFCKQSINCCLSNNCLLSNHHIVIHSFFLYNTFQKSAKKKRGKFSL